MFFIENPPAEICMKFSRLFSKIALICLCILLSLSEVSAKDEWIRIRSKNFQLLSNAAEKDARGVANRLEQFRETFRQLFTELNFDSPVPVNVVLFKNDESFRDFKPVNDENKTRDWVRGYFQTGEAVNYIALTAEGEKTDAYRTIFHEYTHFLISNNLGIANVPPWFNEGLAEYYETFQIEDDRKVTLGSVNNENLLLLRQNRLIPSDAFFNTDNYTLNRQNSDGAGLFYAQSWALMHYLTQGDNTARSSQLNEFISLITKGKKMKEAFAETFQIDYPAIEGELREYIRRKNFPARVVNLKNKINFDGEMKSESVSETEAKAVLGDLLYHLNRLDAAAALLEEVLKTNAASSLANASLGLVKLRQNKLSEARKLLETAVALDDKNYLAHYRCAYVLSREGMTDYGFVSGYSADQTAKMREHLEKAIRLNPDFAESYNLYALISVVRNEEIERAAIYIGKALNLAPGNQWYQMRVAEIYLRKEDFSNARKTALKIFETAPDDRLRVFAKTTLMTINSLEAQLESIKNNRLPQPTEVTDKPLTEEEMARLNEIAMRESINQNLRRLKTNEKRVLGYLAKIQCRADQVDYSIRVDNVNLNLSSENFDSLRLTTFDAGMSGGQIGCQALQKELFAVVTYRPSVNENGESAGEVVAIEFVPKNFILSK